MLLITHLIMFVFFFLIMIYLWILSIMRNRFITKGPTGVQRKDNNETQQRLYQVKLIYFIYVSNNSRSSNRKAQREERRFLFLFL